MGGEGIFLNAFSISQAKKYQITFNTFTNTQEKLSNCEIYPIIKCFLNFAIEQQAYKTVLKRRYTRRCSPTVHNTIISKPSLDF